MLGHDAFLRCLLSLTSEVEEVVVLELVDSLKLTANVELLSSVEEVLDTGVSVIIAAKDLLGLIDPVEKPVLATNGLVCAESLRSPTCQVGRHPRQSGWRGFGRHGNRGV
jgi:hypothetical protein